MRGPQRSARGGLLKKANTREARTRREYNFRGGVRGKYAARYALGSNVILLDPDVAEMFPDSRSVNRALRTIRSILEDQRVGRKLRRD